MKNFILFGSFSLITFFGFSQNNNVPVVTKIIKTKPTLQPRSVVKASSTQVNSVSTENQTPDILNNNSLIKTETPVIETNQNNQVIKN